MAIRKLSLAMSALAALALGGCTTLYMKSVKAGEVPVESMEQEFAYAGSTTDEMFIASIRWFAESFPVDGSEILYQDKMDGIIVAVIVSDGFDGFSKVLVKQNLTINITQERIVFDIRGPSEKTIGGLFSGPEDLYLYADNTYRKISSERRLWHANQNWIAIIKSYAVSLGLASD